MDYQQWLIVLTPIVVATLGVAGTVWGKRLSKRAEQASAVKTEAEAENTNVATARGLVEEVKKLYAEQRAINAEQRVDYEARLAATRVELNTLSERVKTFEQRQVMLFAALAAHAPWDEAAWATLRTTTPGYPAPPPLNPNTPPNT